MVKIDRRGYKQHIRILCITTERVYIITKKKSYAKEAVLLKDILGVSCTPRRDGFICFHTRETREDRVRIGIGRDFIVIILRLRVIGFLLLIILVNLLHNFLWLWGKRITMIIF